MKESRMEQLIDFLVVAARLVQIKSRALLPKSSVKIEDEEEEDPAEALVRQLIAYKRFKAAATWLQEREEKGLRTYLRVAPPPKLESRLDLSGITVGTLLTAVRAALARVEEQTESVAIIQPRRITIEGQIARLRIRAKQGQPFQFRDLLSEETNGVEISVTLLAVLELIKRQEIVAHQTEMFGPIDIQANGEKTAVLVD
jgi:segregation and condensation protein A